MMETKRRTLLWPSSERNPDGLLASFFPLTAGFFHLFEPSCGLEIRVGVWIAGLRQGESINYQRHEDQIWQN